MTAFTDAHNAYWEARKRVQAEQRLEIDARLSNEIKNLQNAIQYEMVNNHKSIAQLASEAERKNKNFLYQIMNGLPIYAPGARTWAKEAEQEIKENPYANLVWEITPEITPKEANNYQVTVTDTANPKSPITLGEWYVETNEYGELRDFPREWSDMELPKTTRNFYRGLIAFIEDRPFDPTQI